MNEQNLTAKITRRLDESLDQLKPSVVYRLASARAAALARLSQEPALGMSGWGVLAGGGRGWPAASRRILFPLAALILSLCVWAYLDQTTRQAESVELDAQMMADELPLTAYLDQGFESWLKHSTPQR